MSIEGDDVACIFAGCARPVATGAEEFVEHVVLVGGENQAADGQAHLPRDMRRENVAEVAGRYGKIHHPRIISGRRKITLEVIDDLRGDPRPVDRVDGADLPARLEFGIARHGLHEVLALVERPFDGKVEDVRFREREHLRLLEGTHPAFRRQHENGDAPLAAHRVFGRAAGVARCRTQDVDRAARAPEHVLEQIAEQLQRDVLERERGAVGDAKQVKFRRQRCQRRDLVGSEHGRVVRVGDDPLQVFGGNVADEAR